MSQHCTHRHPDGTSCKRWPTRGSLFCYRHQPQPKKQPEENDANLSALDRLTTYDDVFDVVRETLNAIRVGNISPGRAYAAGYFIDLWMRVREKMLTVGDATKKFQKRRRLSNAVEQATFDLVAEKVIEIITGRTIEQIERDGGNTNGPGEEHWTQKPLNIIDEMLGVRRAEAAEREAKAAEARARESSPQSPLPDHSPREPEVKK